MYLESDSFGGGTYPKTFIELNCTSNGFSYNFLNLAVKQSPHSIFCYIFDKSFQPEYTVIDMIHMPLVHSICLLLLSWVLSIVSFTCS
jgi:hypothetical protein